MKNTVVILVVAAIVVVGVWFFVQKSKPGNGTQGAGQVVVYTAQDQEYAEPLLKMFEEQTGIKVIPKYDAEATKTVGLAGQLLQEKDNPQCDLFWGNEPLHTVRLAKAGVFEAYTPKTWDLFPDGFKDKNAMWTGFGARARVFVVNTTRPGFDTIKGLDDLLRPEFKGKLCMPKPLAGTATTQMAALYSLWGKEKFTTWFKGLMANDVRMLDGNSFVADGVGSAEYTAGITDIDDAISRKEKRGMKIEIVFSDADGMGCLVFPETLSIIKGCKNAQNAKMLYDWMLMDRTELWMCNSPAAQIPLNRNLKAPVGRYDISSIKAMKVDWNKVAEVYDEAAALLKELTK
ncbi:MAG: ABC transporter substrate-binding protein [Candidatus Brocadiia bacterium]